MRHHITLVIFLSVVAFQIPEALAIDSETNREAIISPRSKRFYKSNSARQYLSLGGNYSSDYNSKSYQFNSRYLYQSNNYIHELNFKNEHEYGDIGSGAARRYNVKRSELYDFSIASKARISDSRNYGVIFHRTLYDNLSDYGYNLNNAIGLGRMFFKEKVELDLSVGYRKTKNDGSEINFIPSIRTNFKITNRLTLIQRGYWFIDYKIFDNELKSSLVYRLSDKLSFELRHAFEQRRYVRENQINVTNQISRSVTVGLIFDLN